MSPLARRLRSCNWRPFARRQAHTTLTAWPDPATTRYGCPGRASAYAVSAPGEREQARASSLHPEGQCSADQTWTEHQVCYGSSQLSTPPANGLRSRQPLREPHPLLIMSASDGTSSPRR